MSWSIYACMIFCIFVLFKKVYCKKKKELKISLLFFFCRQLFFFCCRQMHLFVVVSSSENPLAKARLGLQILCVVLRLKAVSALENLTFFGSTAMSFYRKTPAQNSFRAIETETKHVTLAQ
jgi:hypothetical protein